MKTVLLLLLNDLRRDWKRPWSTLLFAALPLVLSVLIALVFGGRGSSGPMPALHVAVLDEDKDTFSDLLRSLPAQGDAAKNLHLHWVETREEGLRLVEKGEVSALVVLPKDMTVDLLKGQSNSLELYENPAQQVMPKIVRQGVSLLALGLSTASETLREPLQDFRTMARTNTFPAATEVGQLAEAATQKLGNLRPYLFPPIVQYHTVDASDFAPFTTNSTSLVEKQ